MHDFLVSVEAAPFSVWLRQSGSIWAYPTILTAHTLGMGLLVGGNTVLDLRLLGVGPGIPLGPMVSVFRAMWVGVGLSAVTGAMLFCADATTKGTADVFFVKLAFIALALIVAKMEHAAVYGRGADAAVISAGTRMLAVASLVLWAGATVAGRFMAYL
jgi:hypothetical protein